MMERKPASRLDRRAMSGYAVIAAAILVAACLALWPTVVGAAAWDGELLAHEHNGGSGSGTGGTAWTLADAGYHAFVYGVRAVYYTLLLFVAGVSMFGLLGTIAGGSSLRTMSDKWLSGAMRGLLLAVLVYLFFNMNGTVQSFGGGADAWVSLLTGTRSGAAQLALLALSIVGFAAIKLPDLYRMLWALLLLAAESFIGHAAAAEQGELAILFDFIHLGGSAIWASGVILLLLLWRSDRKEAGRFAEAFASVAWVAISVLVVSGIVMVWTLIPSPLYLLYTGWGKWMLAKAALALAVIALGTVLRRRARRGELPRAYLLKLDGALMAGIIAIVAIFTAWSPVPGSEPVRYHQMGATLHYTLKLSPNAPGPNEVSLQLWLPEGEAEPDAVVVRLKTEGRERERVIEAPLTAQGIADGIEFPGFVSYLYEARDIQLPYPGAWTAEIGLERGAEADVIGEVPFRNDGK